MPGKDEKESEQTLQSERSLRRVNSSYLGVLVEDGYADVYLVNKNNGSLIPWVNRLDISETKQIGSGCQGKVYAAVSQYTEDGVVHKRLCAVKEITEKSHAKKPVSLQHGAITKTHQTSIESNVIKLIAVIEKEDDYGELKKYLLLPYCGLFLDDLIKALPSLKEKNPALYEVVVLHALTDLLQALESIHGSGYVHADVKGANIAYYLGHLCLIDLDCALPIGGQVQKTTGTPFYMHPACFENVQFCARTENDIYALGVVLSQMLGDQKTEDRLQECSAGFSGVRIMIDNALSAYRIAVDIERRKESPDSTPGLQEAVSSRLSILSKLECIAEKMMGLIAEQQPKVNELLKCCEALKEELLSSHRANTVEEQEKELREFYESLIPRDFLSKLAEDIDHPVNPNRTLSSCSIFSSGNRDGYRTRTNSSAGQSDRSSLAPTPKASPSGTSKKLNSDDSEAHSGHSSLEPSPFHTPKLGLCPDDSVQSSTQLPPADLSSFEFK